MYGPHRAARQNPLSHGLGRAPTRPAAGGQDPSCPGRPPNEDRHRTSNAGLVSDLRRGRPECVLHICQSEDNSSTRRLRCSLAAAGDMKMRQLTWRSGPVTVPAWPLRWGASNRTRAPHAAAQKRGAGVRRADRGQYTAQTDHAVRSARICRHAHVGSAAKHRGRRTSPPSEPGTIPRRDRGPRRLAQTDVRRLRLPESIS